MPWLHRLRLCALLRCIKRREECLGLHFERIRPDHAFSNQSLRIARGYWGGVSNPSVQERLREVWLISFVVAILAPAPHVDEYIFAKGGSPFRSKACHEITRFSIATIDMEDGRFNHLGDIGAVRTHVGVTAVRSEANLVVDDNVHRSADVVTNKASHVEGFCNHALTRKRCIAMEKHRKHFGNAFSQ